MRLSLDETTAVPKRIGACHGYPAAYKQASQLVIAYNVGEKQPKMTPMTAENMKDTTLISGSKTYGICMALVTA